jgi:predicted HicB family RNase H-like nuclease
MCYMPRMCYMDRDAVLNLRIRQSLKERLAIDAKAEGISVAALARRILAAHYQGFAKTSK